MLQAYLRCDACLHTTLLCNCLLQLRFFDKILLVYLPAWLYTFSCFMRQSYKKLNTETNVITILMFEMTLPTLACSTKYDSWSKRHLGNTYVLEDALEGKFFFSQRWYHLETKETLHFCEIYTAHPFREFKQRVAVYGPILLDVCVFIKIFSSAAMIIIM